MYKYCINCKHVEFNYDAPDLSKCHRNPERDLVSGRPVGFGPRHCRLERMGQLGCSRDGIYYEPSFPRLHTHGLFGDGMLYSYDDPQLVRS